MARGVQLRVEQQADETLERPAWSAGVGVLSNEASIWASTSLMASPPDGVSIFTPTETRPPNRPPFASPLALPPAPPFELPPFELLQEAAGTTPSCQEDHGA